MKRGGFKATFAILVLLMVPFTVAEPEVRPVSESAVSVDGSTDFISISNVAFTGTELQITSPDGKTMNVLLVSTSGSLASIPEQNIMLDGTGGGSESTVSGDLSGASADGTWTITSNYAGGSVNIRISLTVQGKTIEYGYNQQAQTLNQLWNWHQTDATWREPSTDPPPFGTTAQDPLDEGPEEDPEFARYYAGEESENAPEGNPVGFTADSTVDCPDQLDIRGAWARGATQTGNTYGYFRHAAGLQPTAASLTSSTTLTDFGLGFNGTHNATIPYDNLNGNSYQFIVRNGTEGQDQPGQILYAPPQQCNQPLPDFSAPRMDDSAFKILVTQGQCSIDNTTFSVMTDTAIIDDEDLQSFLIDANSMVVVENWTRNDYTPGPASEYFFKTRSIPPGDYVWIAFADLTGNPLVDYKDHATFNVKQGPCTDTVNEIVFENVTVPLNIAILSQILNVTTDTNDGALLVNNMDFETLSFDGFLIMLLLMIIFAICLWHGFTFPMLVSGIGIAMTFMENPPVGFVGIVYLLVIAGMMEYFIGGLEGIRKRFRSGKHDSEEGSRF